jgi:putative phosphoesterase
MEKVVFLGDFHIPERSSSFDFLDILEKEEPDLVIGTGDYTSVDVVERIKENFEFKGISGNCDYEVNLPEELEFECFGMKFVIIHGNQFGRGNLHALKEYGRMKNADVLVFAHTHEPFLSWDELYLINPGSATGAYAGDGISRPKSILVVTEDGFSFKRW